MRCSAVLKVHGKASMLALLVLGLLLVVCLAAEAAGGTAGAVHSCCWYF